MRAWATAALLALALTTLAGAQEPTEPEPGAQSPGRLKASEASLRKARQRDWGDRSPDSLRQGRGLGQPPGNQQPAPEGGMEARFDPETGERYYLARPDEGPRRGAVWVPPWVVYAAGAVVVLLAAGWLVRRARTR